MRPLIAIAALLIAATAADAGIFRRSCPPRQSFAEITYVQPSETADQARFRCPDGRCPKPQPEPTPPPQFDFPDDPAPTPERDVEPVSEGPGKLDAIIALISAIAGAIAAFIATREDEDDEDDVLPPPETPKP